MKKTWLITGISRGFGKVLTEELLKQGYTVIGTVRYQESSISHKNLHTLKLDVTDAEQVSFVFQEALQISPNIDVVVNNAGFGLVGAVEEVSISEAKTVFETNFFGTLNMIQAALPTLRKQRKGHIVNFSSMAGFIGLSGFGIYSAAKFAIEGLSEALATEVNPLGIDVTIVEPGSFRTDFLSNQSLVHATKVIDDYNSSSGKVRISTRERDGQQPGDPILAMRLLIQAVIDKDPPLRLPLGSDCLDRVRNKIEHIERYISKWGDIARETCYSGT